MGGGGIRGKEKGLVEGVRKGGGVKKFGGVGLKIKGRGMENTYVDIMYSRYYVCRYLNLLKSILFVYNPRI